MFWRNIMNAMFKVIIAIEAIGVFLLACTTGGSTMVRGIKYSDGGDFMGGLILFIIVAAIGAVAIVITNAVIGTLLEMADNISRTAYEAEKTNKILTSIDNSLRSGSVNNNGYDNRPPVREEPRHNQPRPVSSNTHRDGSSGIWICKNCGKSMSGIYDCCSSCGADRVQQNSYRGEEISWRCPECDALNDGSTRRCRRCGTYK